MAIFRVVILMPVFRDWEAASLVCAGLDREIAKAPELEASVLLVDDGSPEGVAGWTGFEPSCLRGIDVLHLTRNVGHQRAIAIGLCHIHEQMPCDAVLVMDADGEDRAESALVLLEQAMANTGQIVFAERRKRLAGTMFQAGYLLFRILHRLLTGIPVRVGNFSVIPRASLRRLVAMTELWNHYAGAVFKSKLPFFTIPADRGQRLCGESRMNLVALVAHGLAGIATFYDAVATRILIFNVVGMAVLLLVLLGGLALKLSGNPFVPGWAEYTAGLMLVLVTQLAAVSFSLVFSLIVTRGNMPFIPIRDYRIFADGVENLWSRP